MISPIQFLDELVLNAFLFVLILKIIKEINPIVLSIKKMQDGKVETCCLIVLNAFEFVAIE